MDEMCQFFSTRTQQPGDCIDVTANWGCPEIILLQNGVPSMAEIVSEQTFIKLAQNTCFSWRFFNGAGVGIFNQKYFEVFDAQLWWFSVYECFWAQDIFCHIAKMVWF